MDTNEPIPTDDQYPDWLVPLSDWLEDEPKGPPWLIPKLLPANGGALVTGPSKKAAKSQFAAAAAIALTTGKGPPLLRPVEGLENAAAIIIQEEGPHKITWELLRAIAKGHGASFKDLANIHLAFHKRAKLDDLQWQQRILRAAEQLKANLIVLDPFYKLHSGDENSNSDVGKVLSFLGDLRARVSTQPATMLIHHLEKSRGASKKADRDDQLRGAGALANDYDIHLALRRYNWDDQVIELHTTCKGDEARRYEVRWKYDKRAHPDDERMQQVVKAELNLNEWNPEEVMSKLRLQRLTLNTSYDLAALKGLWGVGTRETRALIATCLEDGLLKTDKERKGCWRCAAVPKSESDES